MRSHVRLEELLTSFLWQVFARVAAGSSASHANTEREARILLRNPHREVLAVE